MSKFWLSKLTFVKSLQCQKALYLNKHHKELRGVISSSQQAIFDQGIQVGELSQQLFPNGIDVSPEEYYDFSKSIESTKKLLKQDSVVIYEAAFEYDGVLCALDILVKENGVIKAYEVKSSTEVKSVYIQDAGLQFYVMQACGYEPDDISIVHINNQYERLGELEIDKLFSIISIYQDVLAFQNDVPMHIEEASKTLDKNDSPRIDIGPHCEDPYACDFMGHCWQHIPEYSVFDISRLRSNKKFELYNKGAVDILDVPHDYLNANQILQVESERNGSIQIDQIQIKSFLDGLNYPLHFLDFETFMTAVPLFDNIRPYQQTVFQYSLHIQVNPGEELKHFEFLAEANGKDPRKLFAEQLINDCNKKGDILVYNIGFESSRLKELKAIFPDKSDALQTIIDRMVDLMVPFQKKYYYAPDLKGSYSIKKVLPSLVPELNYSELEIQEGGTAMEVFKNMILGSFAGDIKGTRKALLEYCKMDTWAMVKILERLREMC